MHTKNSPSIYFVENFYKTQRADFGKRVADAYLLLQIINICSPHAAKQLLPSCCGNLQVNGLHCTMQVLTASTDLQVLTASTDGPLLFNLPVLKFSGHGHPLQH